MIKLRFNVFQKISKDEAERPKAVNVSDILYMFVSLCVCMCAGVSMCGFVCVSVCAHVCVCVYESFH